MKIQYLTTLATASLLSLGLVAACGNPCAAKTDSKSNNSAATQTNPCAGKENPCAGKDNP